MADLVEIARINGPHGLRGRIRITPFGGSFESFIHYTHVMIGSDPSPVALLSVQKSKGSYIIALEGYTHISQVEHLKGQILHVRPEQLEPLPEGEYYWRDLIGLRVVDREGALLGEVVSVLATGSNDVLVVDEFKQHLIPFTGDVIVEVSLGRQCIVVDASLLEGLLD
ncbi:MAG TPA: ribosome maturation factor RimM [Deltaproteobacteria bacterium]|nr:ribosome maturation factor RimM [Deltaproteobacteria bacterium]